MTLAFNKHFSLLFPIHNWIQNFFSVIWCVTWIINTVICHYPLSWTIIHCQPGIIPSIIKIPNFYSISFTVYRLIIRPVTSKLNIIFRTSKFNISSRIKILCAKCKMLKERMNFNFLCCCWICWNLWGVSCIPLYLDRSFGNCSYSNIWVFYSILIFNSIFIPFLKPLELFWIRWYLLKRPLCLPVLYFLLTFIFKHIKTCW